MRHIIITLLLPLSLMGAHAQSHEIEQTLKTIESNNLELKAMRHTVDAEKTEARTQLNLDNPELSVAAMKGPDNIKTHEWAIMQQFAFPTHYVALNRQAKYKSEQADATQGLTRRNVLLQAQMLCLELIANHQQQLCLAKRQTALQHLNALFAEAIEHGDVSAINASRIAVETIAVSADIQEAQQEQAKLSASLQALNGGLPLTFTAQAFPLSTLPLDTATLFHHHLQAHPLMRLAQARANVAEQNISTTRTAALPQLGVGYKQSRDGVATFRGLQLSLSIPLFAHRSRVKVAKAQAASNALQVKNQQTSLHTSLSEQWHRAKQLQQALEQMPTHTLSQALDLLMQALENNEITLQQYVQESTEIFNTMQQRINLELEYHKATAILNQHTL